MTVSLKHAYTAVGTDAGNGEVGKVRWNEEHTLTGGANMLLGFGGSGLPTEYPRNIITVPGSDSNITVTDSGTGATATITLDGTTRGTFSSTGLSVAGNLVVAEILQLSKLYEETVYAPSAASAFTVNLSNGTVQILPTSANCTITLPSASVGRSYVLIVAYGGTHTLTWAGGTSIKWAGNSAPSTTSANGKYDIFSFICSSTLTFAQMVGKGY